MKITKIPVGYLEANCYVLEENNKVIIIDPGDDYEKISKVIGNKEIVKILITHYHQDHIGTLRYFDETLILKNPKERSYNFEPFNFKVIFTKGHTSDSVTYYFMKLGIMFTGDFLFRKTIGRTDMPTGSMKEMEHSLDIIKTYPDNTKIYPGHGDITTLQYEKENNYFLK